MQNGYLHKSSLIQNTTVTFRSRQAEWDGRDK